MLIKTDRPIPSSEITTESSYLKRRQFIGAGAALASGALLAGCGRAMGSAQGAGQLEYRQARPGGENGFYTDEALTPFEDITSYNNFYEFGTDKGDPARLGKHFRVEPWSVAVEGEVAKPGTYTLEDILKPHAYEERIYRLRCVEAWSMVVPWVGFPLADLLKRFEPSSKAKYVQFTTLYDPKRFPGQRSAFSTIDWPYVEGLRMDEAMHPLTLMAVGLYGKELLPQNGAPLRLVVPWKYGFKSIKSIVKIRFIEQRPNTTWELLAPSEYGFYANVNPQVDHPRWSQKHERRLPNSLWNPNRIETRLFNGYAEQVAGLYAGMDLNRYY